MANKCTPRNRSISGAQNGQAKNRRQRNRAKDRVAAESRRKNRA